MDSFCPKMSLDVPPCPSMSLDVPRDISAFLALCALFLFLSFSRRAMAASSSRARNDAATFAICCGEQPASAIEMIV